MEIGTIVAGKYLLDRVVGQGGMGLVVRATHLQLHQPVAIKFLLPEAARNAETVKRFRREARAAVRLRSEHVARVIDVGALDTGTPYMVLEYLEGTDLESFPRGQLTIGALVDLLLQACEALAEAHALGIVHRDIKPANFFITRDPGGGLFLKLLDFGVSKTAGATGKLTGSQVVLGTPAYMSPEQVRASRRVDPRSDIWSLGVVLYELIEGAPPFDTEAFSAMVLQIVNDPPGKLTARLPAGLDGVIYRCLEKDPAHRFQSAAELAAALAPYAGSPAQAAITLERTRGLDPGPRRVATCADDAAAPPRSPPTALARRWRRALIAAAGILAGVGVVELVILRGDTTAARLQDPAAEVFAPAAAEPTGTPTTTLAVPLPVAAPPPAPASPTAPAAAPAPAPAPPAAPGSDMGADVARPADGDAAATAGSGRPPETPVRRPHRPRPTRIKRVPASADAQHDSPSKATVSPRFDRGD